MPALPRPFADRSGHSNGMRYFQRVVANRAARRDSDVNGRSPALQAVMPGAMEQVGDADGSRRSRRLDPSKQRMVVHNGVCQESFINAAAAKIECRSVVQAAPRANAREQPIVLAVQKMVNAGRGRIGRLGGLGRFLLVRGSGASSRLWCGMRVWIPAFGRRLLLPPDRGHGRE
jgi:hypothetical protein